MKLSIVIPAFNEAENIGALVHYLLAAGGESVAEVVVADGGSTDQTQALAAGAGALVVQCPRKGRAPQMNYGASKTTGDVLYFIHADTRPPVTFAADISAALAQGYDLGRYRSKFLSDSWLLRINEWFTRFDLFIGMGGDQTLFIRRALFQQSGGFNEAMVLMEEFEFCQRVRNGARYKIMNGAASISARKYAKNSWLAVQLANYKVVSLYRRGASQQEMVEEYRRRLQW